MKNFYQSLKNEKVLKSYLILFIIPLILGIITYITVDYLVLPALTVIMFSMIIIFFWKFFKELLSVSLISILAFVIITVLLALVLLLLIKYNGSENIPWDINLLEIFGINKYL